MSGRRSERARRADGARRVAIVGGGITGLATAALLARDGHRVTLFERRDELGGRAGSWSRDGFRFDTGPSWYLMPEVFEHFFAQLGADVADELDLERLDPALSRPGRMDVHVEFRLASRWQAAEMFRRFYGPLDGEEEEQKAGEREVKVEGGSVKIEGGSDAGTVCDEGVFGTAIAFAFALEAVVAGEGRGGGLVFVRPWAESVRA